MFDESYESGGLVPRTVAPAVWWLLALNIGVYFLQVTVIPPDRIFGTLALDPATFPGTWWTPITYMFVHAGLWHLGMNMFTLWMFGTRVEQAWTTRRFVFFYLWCGIGGAIAHLIFARGTALVGASAGVIGVLLAYALLWPEDRVYLFGFIPMRSRWLVAWLIGINIALGLSAQTIIGWKAHLGGLAFGWVFLRAGPMIGRVGNSKVADHTPCAPVPDDHAKTKNARMNVLLDKISRHGLESLTDEERRLLDETSRDLRGSPKRG